MNELLASLCAYTALQGQGNVACRTTLPAAYNSSAIAPLISQKQKEVEKYGVSIVEEIPYNKELGGAAVLYTDIQQKSFKIPIDSHLEVSYTNFNKVVCNMKWSF